MKTRIITGFILCLIGVPLLIFAPVEVFLGLSFVLSIAATFELTRMFDNKREVKMSIFSKIITYILVCVINASISVISYLNYKEIEIDLYKLVIIAILVLLFIIGSLLIFDKTVNSEVASKMAFTALYVGAGFATIPVLSIYSRGMLFYVVTVACFTDVFAYFFGVALGTKIIKKRPAPVISPKKSFEGCIFGSIFGAVFGSLVFIFYNELFDKEVGGTLLRNVCSIDNRGLEITIAIILTLVASVVGQIGDLVASKLKRDYEIKDYSNIFPGHGGVLDRFDSNLFICTFITIIFLLISILLPL